MPRAPTRWFTLGALVGALAVVPAAAQATSIDCTSKPDSPVGYQVTEVHADAVTAPASTPPIAILDSGVASVPELAGRVRQGANVVNGTTATNDIDGHGTAVAAIAAATAGGVRGISPSSPVIPIKMFDDAGNASPDDFIAAIERAVALNAGVINISAEVPVSDLVPADAARMKDAIYAAVSLGIPVIAASGNEGDARLDAPAAFPHVLAVGATGASGEVAAYSNSGTGLDLVAPGSEIVTAAPSALCASGYGTVTGTSFAAPAVSGAAALLLAEHPDLDVGQLDDMLRLRGVQSPAPGWTIEKGFGLLDVAASLAAPVPAADLPEVNDTIQWAKLQSAVLTTARRARTLSAHIAPHADPVDVYQLRLKKGDRFSARLKQNSGARLRLSFGSAKLASRSGQSFSQRIKRTGKYYIGVSIDSGPDGGSTYALTLKR
jgi:subtilisin family serine protease